MLNHSSSNLPRIKELNGKDIQGIYEQNNYTNKCLQTLGEYLLTKPIPKTSSMNISSSNPLFKPHEIPTKFYEDLQIKPITQLKKRIAKIEQSFSTPTSKQGSNNQGSASVSQSTCTITKEEFQECLTINKLQSSSS